MINDQGELPALCLTPGNVDDRRPVPRLARRLFGKLFGDRGYISQLLAEQLWVRYGLRLITKVRRNLRERLLSYTDKLLLCKRALIESVNDQLKNICQIEHSRRALDNIFVERLWRSVKYEEVYVHDYETVSDAVSGLTRYFGFYNEERLHQALQYQTPARVYGSGERHMTSLQRQMTSSR